MAVRHGYGKVAGTDALVFAYDIGDTVNSYKGEPTVNLVTNPDFATGNYSGWSSTGVGGAVQITGVFSENGYNYFHKKVNKVTAGGLDRITQSSVYTINTSLQTTVTFDIWINPLNAYGITFYGLGSTADDTVYDEKPLASNGTTLKTVNLGGGWNRYIYTLSTAWYTGTGNTFRVAVYPDYGGTGLLEYKLRRVQVEQKSHATPFVNGTRSSTQGLLDLTGRGTIDLTNVSFDSNAQMTFDGTDDQFVISDPNTGTTFSMEFIVKANEYSSNPILISPNSLGYDHFVRINSSGKVFARFVEVADSSTDSYVGTTTLALGKFYHVTVTKSPTNGTIYVNGVAEDSHTPTLPAAAWSGTWKIGARENNTFWFNGEIPVVKIYNRVLTADEVRNNFYNYKTRFNI